MSPLVTAQIIFLQDFADLIRYASSLGLKATAGELWRPPEMQAIYVKTGRSKTLNSQHGSRLAGDLNFFRDGQLVQTREAIRPLGEWWESKSTKHRWGGSWRGQIDAGKSSFVDVPHFELLL